MSETFPVPVSRHSPCPCGSGRRYKDCHGAIGATVPGAVTAPAMTPRSSYRAPGREWAHLDETTRDVLGARMEQALALQTAGRVDEAARDYREVIAAAPDTHDALHMLGVIELNRGDLDAAERLIAAALALRVPYPAIQHNRQLVEDARLARAHAQPEELAEGALPIMVELALSPSAAGRVARGVETRKAEPSAKTVHLIGRLHDESHDDTWLIRRLAALLKPLATVLWSVDGSGIDAVPGHRVERIDSPSGSLPRGGVHVYVGVQMDPTRWIERAEAERVVVFCQGAPPTRYLDALRCIARDGARPLELIFASRAMARCFGAGHRVLPPPIDLATLHPASPAAAAPYDEWPIEAPPPWPLGIVGQNQQFLEEPQDVDFVKTLARLAGRLHIFDPGRFRYVLGGRPDTRFFARRPGALEACLAALACFVYRAGSWWQESLGRDLYGAMALGVPVLCPRTSIHAERIEHGVDGFLYASVDEAQRQISDLRRAPALAAAMGRAARDKAQALFEPQRVAQSYRDFLAGEAGRSASAAIAAPTHVAS